MITGVFCVLLGFFLHMTFIKNDSSIYHKKFKSFTEWLTACINHRYVKVFERVLLNTATYIGFIAILLGLIHLILNRDIHSYAFLKEALNFVCTASFLLIAWKACMFVVFDIIKSVKDFSLKMIIW